MSESPPPSPAEASPASLGEHIVPPDRLAGIKAHMATLSATARTIGDALPLEADVADVLTVLERE